ncbi:hypothetical protein Back11_41140 [Paenibacillus baekrokdamisoli]|uniref:Uncharacterized protein n=1 Tax=Paenibacillus baekrokdamisoli TaxID=1712516 RepID=A0A3G9JIC0_9BACL|nr:acetyl-CoA acetyltransferase [Paenibacillus baekrokdamisoli]MBB3068187.1 hypothetical protein [Paenibacillus baekrokdamisoli]BBH22769.1 hypothetical protein Back11_41140 [Paenibacillus baekrokdamisoli]
MSEQKAIPASIIYQADAGHNNVIHNTRRKLHELCAGHMHRAIRVETVDGIVYEGMITHVDRCFLYLHCVPVLGDGRAFFNPNSAIIPLVLYELLVITLLYT